MDEHNIEDIKKQENEDIIVDNVQKKKKNIKKIVVIIIICILLIGFSSFSMYKLIKNPSNTYIVEEGNISEEETIEGYIIRNEKVIKGNNYKNGMVQIKAEGDKVAKDSPIFRYYTNGEEELNEKIKELDQKIQVAMEKQTDLFSGDMKVLEGQIEEELDTFYTKNDMQEIQESKKEIASYITKRAKIVGDLSPQGSYLKNLVEQRKGYENQLNNGAEYVSTRRKRFSFLSNRWFRRCINSRKV